MPTFNRKLSPASRNYLQRLVKYLCSIQAVEIDSPEDLELSLSILDSEQVVNLDQLIHLHRELSSEDSVFHKDIPELEIQIFSLLGLQLLQGRETRTALNRPLGERLINKGLITKQQLDIALREQSSSNKRLGEILVTSRIITFDQLDEILWEQAAFGDNGVIHL